MKPFKLFLSLFIILFAIWVILESPLGIVGEYPMLSSFLLLLISYISLAILFSVFTKKGQQSNKAFVGVVIIVGLGFLPAMILLGIHFKKAKSRYLINNGIVVNGVIIDKRATSLTRKGRKSEGYQIDFSFRSTDNKILKSWDVVSEEEFNQVRVGDTIPVIYAPSKENIADLIMDSKSKEIYQSKLTEQE